MSVRSSLSGASTAPLFAARARPAFARARHRQFVLWLVPALAVLAVVTLLPTIYLVLTCFTPLNLTAPATLFDFSDPAVNYRLLLSDGRFLNSLWVQAKLSFWTVTLQLVTGFLFAQLLNLRSAMMRSLRTIFLIPMVLPPIVVAIIWKVLYTPDISPLHWMARAAGWNVPSLITDPGWALTAIIIADIWEWFPFTMLMILAALQMIPAELNEAAKIDGAGPLQTTIHITIPSIKGTLVVAGLFRLIDSIKAFPLIFVLTDGGPGNVTEVTNYYAFLQAFNFSYLGFSSAITVVLVAATLLLSWLVLSTTGRNVADE